MESNPVAYASIDQFEQLVKAEPKAFILFTGNKDENGLSWCPDCVQAEPFIQTKVLETAKSLGVKLFICNVGTQPE